MAENKSKFGSILEGGLCLLAGAGIGVMMKTAGKMLTPEDAKRITKLACKAGEMALTGALVRVANKEISVTLDEVKQIADSVTVTVNKPEEPNENTEIVEEETENAED